MNTTPTPRSRSARLWRIRAGATTAGAVLIGGAVLGATAASAASQNPSPSARTSSAATAAGHGSRTHHTLRPFVHTLRTELRVDIQAKAGFGDKAHEIAYVLIHHTNAFAKLPANLQADLKTLEAAAAADRDGDATKIKDNAINGGYGAQIQKEAKAIQTKATRIPAKP